MAELGAGAAWLLAGVFGWAALVKLRNPAASASALAGLGVPSPRLLAAALPAVEVSVAVTLLTRPRAGALAALGLLAVFTVVLAERLRRGVTARCGCFGAASSAPVSGRTLARNGLLAVTAAVALAADDAVPPTVPATVAATAAALLGATGLALAELRAVTGRLLALGPLPPPPVEREARP